MGCTGENEELKLNWDDSNGVMDREWGKGAAGI